MPEDKSIIGRPDQDKIRSSLDIEVEYLAGKYAISKQRALEAIKKVGSNRHAAEAYIRRHYR